MKNLYLLVMLIIGHNLFSQNGTFNPDTSNGQLYQYAEFVDVGKNDLTIHQVMNNSDLNYKSLDSENHSIGFTSNNFWLRFSLENSTNQEKEYYLETARPITDIANLYQIYSHSISEFKSGDQIPKWERQVDHRSTVFKISLEPNSIEQFYLHLSSDGETINLPLKLYSETEFLVENYKQQLFMGFFYGILFLAGLVYLFFYRSLKEKTFFYYGIYVFSIGLMQATLDGLIFQYVFPQAGYINSRMVMITALLSNLFLLKYCEHFLKIKVFQPKLFKGFKAVYVIIAALFVMVFISKTTLEYTYPISNVNGLVSLLLILGTIGLMRAKKQKIDPYFSIGIFFLVIGLLGFVMNNLSLLPNNFFVLNSAKFGTGFEVVFLSLSMSNLIRKLRLEKEESQELALKKSEEISQLKTYFMSNMSHELRTPINAIMGVSQEQLKLNKDVETKKNYEIIRNASLSLLSSVNDILDFEKIEKNELELKSESFNPSILINQISNNWKTEAEKKGLQFILDMHYSIPAKVKGDPERFIQIINNTLSNAVKFTMEGTVKMKITCIDGLFNKTKFSIAISDTGIGIADEAKQFIFDSFNQMKYDNKRRFGGIGLGLTIAKHLTTLFKGKIDIESKLGVGTSVFIEIPLEVVSKPELIQKQEPLTDSLRILVVEDNLMNQMIMKKFLGCSSNISFSLVENGQEAIELLRKEIFDLVLMDLQMPVMDGYEATKVIRSGELGEIIENIPIIAVTADAMQETKNRVMDLGMNDYMTKPINKAILMEKIEKCCKAQCKSA
ncbi:MAG: 7TM diverse intracellular signaling domain-containing protein [Flavobacteriaceae bacterium]|nr:response regulator [Mangrovimonas sp.]HPF98403.1 7TM diverse intracellular signaling domain-containing protein [Mangrovimonas sp.]